MEFYSATRSRNNDPGFRGLHRKQQYSSIGSLIYLLFCVTKYGWGWDNFMKEANEGKGIKFPKWPRIYITYILPLIVLFILAGVEKF